MLTLVTTKSHVTLGLEDDARVQALFDEKVNAGRERVVELIRSWQYGIAMFQLYADRVRPINDLELLRESIEFLLQHEIVFLFELEAVVHNERHAFRNQHIKGKTCPCSPEIRVIPLLFHRDYVGNLDMARKTYGYEWAA